MVACVLTLLLSSAGCAAVPDDSLDEPDSVDQVRDSADVEVSGSMRGLLRGEPVTGAGPNQQWEGIVQMGVAGKRCTAFFITERHLLTAAHCFPGSGRMDVKYHAPTLVGDQWITQPSTITINPKYDGNRSDDFAVVRLDGWAEPWADANRRFRLYTGSTVLDTRLYVYGYGQNGSGASGFLQGAPGRAPVRIVNHDYGYLEANAHTARICSGDSGGPAIREGEFAIVWGIAVSSKAGRGESPREGCPTPDDDMFWAKVSYNMAFIESTLGFNCHRGTSENQPYAQCW